MERSIESKHSLAETFRDSEVPVSSFICNFFKNKNKLKKIFNCWQKSAQDSTWWTSLDLNLKISDYDELMIHHFNILSQYVGAIDEMG